MYWLRLVLWATFAIIVAYIVRFIFRLASLATKQEGSFDALVANNHWRRKVLPFFLLMMLNIAMQLPTGARWLLIFHLVLIFFYLPVQSYTTPLKSLLINLYSPKIIHQHAVQHSGNYQRYWNTVKLIEVTAMLAQFWRRKVCYVGLLVIPDLKMLVPIADHTDNDVYLFGAGMLKPQLLTSDDHITIGGHNLGADSHELFSPLARQQLYLQGMKVMLASLDIVKEYRVSAVKIISENDVAAAMAGEMQTITLMTCTEDKQRRILVQAALVKQYPFAQANEELQKRLLKMQ